ncbi:MAG TPA: MprA protease, GlyGly-CTERM protein-sorting domain-containing form, partial [Cupriavidus sp.]|nr:MprA protease, GlyGly-CTERM protein-sorting domain-containing form [Cupriavidus sp.]
GGGAMVPWSAALLLVMGVMGFAIRRRVGVKRA